MPIKNPKSPNAELGRNNDTLYEPENEVLFDSTNSEKVIRGQNNTWIVLGRDRPSNRASGYGGNGTKKAGAIDIVVGRLSATDATTLSTKRVNPSFAADAARIHLSQKTNIDENFQLVEGLTGASIGNSGIGIKADDVRIIARNSMKLVTVTDPQLSTGARSYNAAGVQLIANNDDSDMQPIPKGDNLQFCLTELKEKILELNGLLAQFVRIQTDFNNVVGYHYHLSPFFGYPTSPSEQILNSLTNTVVKTGMDVEQGLRNHVVSMTNWQSRFLTANIGDYINSNYHFLN